ncbi:hypothetical protein [Aquibacillus sediminis]|nr:hypothetical protein [Aquibacillus sediminis]
MKKLWSGRQKNKNNQAHDQLVVWVDITVLLDGSNVVEAEPRTV